MGRLRVQARLDRAQLMPRIAQMRKEERSHAEISLEIGCAVSTIQKWLQEAGMARINFSAAVKRQIATRATDLKGDAHCEQCGAICPTRADYEIDHCVAEGVRPAGDRRRALAAADGKLLCLACHEKKTRRDKFEIAKAKRLEDKHRVVGRGPTQIARRYGIKQEGP